MERFEIIVFGFGVGLVYTWNVLASFKWKSKHAGEPSQKRRATAWLFRCVAVLFAVVLIGSLTANAYLDKPAMAAELCGGGVAVLTIKPYRRWFESGFGLRRFLSRYPVEVDAQGKCWYQVGRHLRFGMIAEKDSELTRN